MRSLTPRLQPLMFMKPILYLLIMLVTSLTCLPIIANPQSAEDLPYIYDDWVCDASKNKLCKGYYLEQSLPYPGQSSKNLEHEPISITADKGEFASEGDTTASGHVHLIHGNRQAFANQVIVHRSVKKSKAFESIQAIGDVKITEPGYRLDGTSANIDLEQDTEVVQNAHFRLYDRHARGTADLITLTKRYRMILKNASYTTCNPFQNTWALKTSNLDLNKKTGRGRARHARLYIKEIPVFYFPYIDFPIDNRRQTGFLYPGYGVTNRSGVALSAPFYWNIAPNYDATLTPRYLTKRGLEMQGLFRYLSSHSEGEIEGGILPSDRAYRRFKTEKNEEISQLLATTVSINNSINPFLVNPNFLLRDPRITALNKGNSTRTAFRAKNTSVLSSNWSSSFQYQTVGDDNYFMDLGDTLGIASTTQLLQQGDVTYQDLHWKVVTRLQQYQTLHPFSGPRNDNVYKRLPQLTLQNNYSDLPYGFDWAINGEFSRFLHKHDPFTDTAFTTGDRLQLRPALSLPIIYPGWFIKPRIQVNMLLYSLALSQIDAKNQYSKSPSNMIPMLDLDSGLIFERDISANNYSYIQTLEPRAYYLYVPYHDQNRLPNFDTSYNGFSYNQLFRDNRFSGLDRINDANQLTLAITTRFLSETTGSEQISLTLGQIYYFKQRHVTACHSSLDPQCLNRELFNLSTPSLLPNHPRKQNHRSPYVGLARIYLGEDWTANAEIEWNSYKNRRDKEAFFLQYKPSEQMVFNLGYQFLRQNFARISRITRLPEKLDQIDASVAIPITEQWRLLSRWHYDLENRRSNDISLGLEQDGCCTAVRLFVSRFLTPFDDSKPQNATEASEQALFKQNRYSTAIFLQFVFKGLGDVGSNKMTSDLKRSIPGYQWKKDKF
jgi:LPS-assembly protein